jgi:hypothetical protein
MEVFKNGCLNISKTVKDKISYIDPIIKRKPFKMDSITAVTIPRLFGGIYITRPVIGSEQCQSETNVSGSIVEYV